MIKSETLQSIISCTVCVHVWPNIYHIKATLATSILTKLRIYRLYFQTEKWRRVEIVHLETVDVHHVAKESMQLVNN